MPKPADIKRKRQKLRSEFYGHPWAMLASTLSDLGQRIEIGDMESIKSALSFNGDGVETSMKVANGVAVIPMNGVLRDEVDYMVRYGGACSYQILERDFLAAMSNDQVKSVLFYCNSPGGSAIGCKRVADLIFASRGKKQIVAFVQGQCCSASYYIASACDRIEATADSMVGSIGTIMPHVEMSGFLDEMGYGVTVITNSDSPKKGHGNQYEKLTPEAKATLQAFIDSFGKPFIADVARYRGVTTEQVLANFGQGDAKRADLAIDNRMIDAVVTGIGQTLQRMTGSAGQQTPVVTSSQFVLPVAAIVASTGNLTSPEAIATGTPTLTERVSQMKISARVRAQLFACGLIASMEASDDLCVAALNGWFRGTVPADEAAILKGLQASATPEPAKVEASAPVVAPAPAAAPATSPAAAHQSEQSEARLGDLKASAALINGIAGSTVVTAEMVIEACEAKLNPQAAMKQWNEKLSAQNPAVPAGRVAVGASGSDAFAKDAIDAMAAKAGAKVELSQNARQLVRMPLWAIAHQSLALAGSKVDMYGDRELLAEQAMQMGDSTRRFQFFSESEDPKYIQASAGPYSRPGDFPNILSGLANKYLDMIELDDDYSYGEISAVLPGGLNDFKPAMMVNRGILEELDELSDGEKIKSLGMAEEVLSYIFLRRFGNKFGWTPVMIANDDLGAFAEGMIGLQEAWQVTQNRMVLDRITSSETLLDGNALFANRADTGTGTIPAANNNLISSGGAAPSDTTWGAMATLYAGIGGIGTGRRVRGTLNTILVPTNAVHQAAVRTFETYPVIGESKVAATTDNVGIYRNKVKVVPESELNSINATAYYGLRNPTRLNNATVVRGYFNGYGEAGRRERWYDPETKCTYVSLEGRIAVATKNWRFAVKNPGT
jgi:signal peptide peptidase SppA